MARKSFAINTVPHVAEVGGVEFEFEPEASGASFAEAYSSLMEAQAGIGDGTDPAALVKVTESTKEFLASFMLPESRQAFAVTQLPDRILVELVGWVAEIYGGGSAERPTG